MSKKFKGFLCLGAKNKEEAINMKGLQIWTRHTPSLIRRFFSWLLLGMYFVKDEREVISRGDDVFKPKDVTRCKDIPKKKIILKNGL